MTNKTLVRPLGLEFGLGLGLRFMFAILRTWNYILPSLL